jgi:hypothetical protein
LKRKLTSEQRKELEAKMIEALKSSIHELSAEFQRILIDDLVTAFQNRINVLIQAQQKGVY